MLTTSVPYLATVLTAVDHGGRHRESVQLGRRTKAQGEGGGREEERKELIMRIITAQDAGLRHTISHGKKTGLGHAVSNPSVCINCYTSLLRAWPDVSHRVHQGVLDSWTWLV